MSQTLISGYAAFTSPEEFGAASVGEAPGTILVPSQTSDLGWTLHAFC